MDYRLQKAVQDLYLTVYTFLKIFPKTKKGSDNLSASIYSLHGHSLKSTRL